MKSPWTPTRDQRLLAMQATGRSAAEIARVLGTSRSAVIARSARLRGILYPSSIASWKRANAKALARRRKRAAARRQAQQVALREMAKAIASGLPEGKAMARAHQAGAFWWQIGEQRGISDQVAYQRAKTSAQGSPTRKIRRQKTRGRRRPRS
jgi:hypothetical protein